VQSSKGLEGWDRECVWDCHVEGGSDEKRWWMNANFEEIWSLAGVWGR